MRKSIAALVAGVTFAIAPAAYAGPVTLSSDISVKYERDRDGGVTTDSGTITSLTIMGEADLGSGWSLYSRLGAQHLTKAGMGDFNTDYYNANDKTVVSIDQFGFNYQGKNFNYKIGRQDTTIGTTALLYSRPDTNIGKRNFVDGVSFAGKTGAVDLTGIFAREDNISGDPKNKIYAVRAGYNPQENLNWGVTLGRYHADESTNHWAVDGTYTMGKSSLTGEYTKSSSNSDNKAFAMTLNHDFDGKTAVYITNFRVEESGDMGGQSDFDNGNRGFYYGVTHQLNDSLGFEVVYKDQKFISTGVKNSHLEATMSYSF